MPRPSKRVAPDTLGGRLRTARQNLKLSLAQVAGAKYSTSLISQIERNRVDPSTESLQYLAERLKLPLDDLLKLARQHRQSETEANLYRAYEEKYAEINRLLTHHRSEQALTKFEEFDISHLPTDLYWRALALRGQSYFEQRDFANAQRDYQAALTVLPHAFPEEHQAEVVQLRLHLAAATRELVQFSPALAYYKEALAVMNSSTQLRYVAEAHWGLALVYAHLAQESINHNGAEEKGPVAQQTFLQEAWVHAEDARRLYNAIADSMNEALLQCQIALIEQTQNKAAKARERLLEVLHIWQPSLEEGVPLTSNLRSYQPAERANVVSAAACYLAGLEQQAGNIEDALDNVQLAIKAGKESYKVRRAEAFLKLGEILEAQDTSDSRIETAFRQALDALKNTHRIGLRIQAHYHLGSHLISTRRNKEGMQEIEKAQALAGFSRDIEAPRPDDEASANGL